MSKPFIAFLALVLIFIVFILYPNYMRAKATKDYYFCGEVKMREIGEALNDYKCQHNGKYPLSLSELAPGYTGKIPECPSARKDTYSASYEVSQDRTACTFFCKGQHHQGMSYSKYENNPRYSSRFDDVFRNQLEVSEKEKSIIVETDECLKRLESLAVMIDDNKEKNGKYPAKLRDLKPTYLTRLPDCPAAMEVTYKDCYEVDTDAGIYTLRCKGRHHIGLPTDPDYPMYSSKYRTGFLLEDEVEKQKEQGQARQDLPVN